MNQEELRDRKEWLQGQGAGIDIFYQDPAPRLQWYLPDGTPTVNLMRTDPYHMQKYRQKGWTLQPPVGQAEETDGAEVLQFPTSPVETSVAVSEVPEHRHRFRREVGSPCKFRDCSAVRTKAYQRRNVTR